MKKKSFNKKLKKFLLKLKSLFKKEFILFKVKFDKKIHPILWIIILILSSILYLIAVFGFVQVGQGNLVFNPFLRNSYQNFSDKNSVCKSQDILTGECIEVSKQNIFGVMIENHTQARPVSGLSYAKIVFEAMVEGPITRFLAIFDSTQNVNKIGPVRSARPYFVELAQGFNGLYVHVGGSPQALKDIKLYNVKDFDEFYRTSYFWRDRKRKAPHNVYTSIDLLKKGYKDFFEIENFSQQPLFLFKDQADKDTRGKDNQTIFIPYSKPQYNVIWKYEKEQNLYTRYNGNGILYKDVNNKIQVKNIIIMFVKTKVIDNKGRLELDLLGTGKAVAFRDGKKYNLIWKKLNRNSRLEFYKENGRSFYFNKGKTWINIVPSNLKIEYK